MLEAFACFDEKDTGYVSVSQMRQFLSSMGDRMSEEEVRQVFQLNCSNRLIDSVVQDIPLPVTAFCG